jgi:hypothetical protein
MTRQNKENPAVLQASRKKAVTESAQPSRGGKGVPINQQGLHLKLRVGTAEYPKAYAAGATGGAKRPRSRYATREAPKPTPIQRNAAPAIIATRESPRHSATPWADRRSVVRREPLRSRYTEIGRGRNPTGDGGHNPTPRRAVCEKHSYGSVRAGGG